MSKILEKHEEALYNLMCKLDDLTITADSQRLFCSECICHDLGACPSTMESALEKGIEALKGYERLLEMARKMHTWIFLHTADEQAVHDELGLTDEENAMLESIGRPITIRLEGCKEEEAE